MAVIGEVDVDAISKTISVTATDVFVYDTRKDSDGGAWRKRTHHTSWYNETLNTATRGSRKDFPCVAIIVSETNKVTIYDGDDPDLPMWMVFNAGNGTSYSRAQYHLGGYSQPVNTVSMLNGKLVVGLSVNYYFSNQLSVIDFIIDECKTHGSEGKSLWPIARRNYWNGTVNENFHRYVDYDQIIDGSACNDVDMKVLPNSIVDPLTNLPVPTIAVATGGGISVIKDNQDVFDLYHSLSSYRVSPAVVFTSDNRIAYFADQDTTPRRVYISPVPNADTTTVDGSSYPVETTKTVGYGRFDDVTSEGDYNGNLLGDRHTTLAALSDRTIAVGDDTDGLSLVQVQTNTGNHNSLIAHITSSYNTGWMKGNIRFASLSDTDDTDMSGTELVSGNNFSSGSTARGTNNVFTINGDGTLSVGNGNGTSDSWYDITVSTTAGETYVIEITKSSSNGTGVGIYIDFGGGPNGYYWDRTFTFVATQSSTTISLYRFNGHTGTATFDYISVRRAIPDRSVKGNGLQIHGTIPKSAVETGADLVSYGPFDGNNYIEQPTIYTNPTNMQFSGDFYCSLWINVQTFGDGTFLDISDSAGNGDGRFQMMELSTNKFRIYSNSTINDTSRIFHDKVWYKLDILKSSNNMKLYVNGFEELSFAHTDTIGDSDQTLIIGTNYSKSHSPDVKLALVRISSTVPSLEELKKMYDDEELLFEENAQATLYSTNNGINALAYDTDEKRLHVGTSAGRSIFQGLNRMENTTSAVTVAISASNGMVVDE